MPSNSFFALPSSCRPSSASERIALFASPAAAASLYVTVTFTFDSAARSNDTTTCCASAIGRTDAGNSLIASGGSGSPARFAPATTGLVAASAIAAASGPDFATGLLSCSASMPACPITMCLVSGKWTARPSCLSV